LAALAAVLPAALAPIDSISIRVSRLRKPVCRL
jgi:hypothetical protein